MLRFIRTSDEITAIRMYDICEGTAEFVSETFEIWTFGLMRFGETDHCHI